MPPSTNFDTTEWRVAFGRSTLAQTLIVPVCPLCQGRDNEKAFLDNGCELRVCRVCGLFFVHPYPLSNPRHEEVSAGNIAGIDLLDCERRYAGEALYYQRHFAMIEDECHDARSFLDVGCGTGRLLELLSARKEMRRLGIELNPHAAKFARRVAKCDIVETPFEDFRIREGFDVVSMINVFSHIPSLDALFHTLRQSLTSGGKAILRTSEMTPDVSRWNQLHWGIPDDLHFLGLNTIAFICRKYGFEVRKHVRLPYEDELFLVSRWRQMGRRGLVNLVKRAGVCVPGALGAMKSIYRAALGERLFVSLIVLSRTPETTFVGKERI